ncbi:hypothetical protein IWX49DRAFT_55666 [Phyllosticta citricarpa]
MTSCADQDSLDTQRMEEIKFEISKQWPPDNALSSQRSPATFDLPSPSTLTSPVPSRHDRLAYCRCSGLSLHPIPRLTPTRTYPNPTSNASLNFLKMNHTFAAFDGGDTQPMDSQIYKEYTKTYVAPQDSYNGDSLPPETYREGDAGHVDLFSDFIDVPQDNETRNNTQVSYSEGIMSDSPFRTDPTSHPTHFLPPQTPALGCKKRGNGGEVVATSATKTPGSAVPTPGLFNNGTGVPTLSLSQAFSNTQEPTSPQMDGARSDPVRPSPNINMRFDSDAAALSSPTKMMPSEVSRAASEPGDTYMPIKESRETRYRQRKAELEQKLRRLKAQDGDEYVDELADEQRKAEQKSLKRQIDELAAKCDASVGVSGDGLRARRRKPFGATKSDTALFTPIHARVKQDVVVISDDAGLSDSEDELVSEPPTLERPLVSQTNIQVPKSSSRGVRASQDDANDSPTSRASQEKARLPNYNNLNGGGDDVAVADSQPYRQSQQEINRPPTTLQDPSSLDTRIAQSQLSVLSAGRLARIEARTKQVLETSSVPPPPAGSHQAAEEADADADEPVIPSSPPLLAMNERDDVDDERPDGEDIGAVNDDFDKPDPGYDFDGGVDYIESSPGPDEQNDDAHQVDQRPDEIDEYPSESEDDVGNGEPFVERPDDPDIMVTEVQEETQQDEVMEEDETGQSQAHQATELGRVRTAIPDSDHEGRDCLDMSSQVVQEQPATSAHLPENIHQSNLNDVTDSHETPLPFGSARTHNSGMESPRKSQPSPTKSLAQPTPKSTRPFRLLTEIAADPSQRQEEVEDIEIQTDILDDDDKEFAEIMSAADSSPFRPAKRLKTYSHRALRESPKKINRIPEGSPTPTSPSLKSPNAATRTEADQEEEIFFSKPAVPKPGIFLPSPSKQAQTTLKKALQERSTKTRRTSNAVKTQQTANKKGPAKPTKKTSASRSRKQDTAQQLPEDDTAGIDSEHPGLVPVDLRSKEVNIDTEEQTREVVAPERVLARFKGFAISYYPATCVSTFMTGRVHCKIRFDDGTEDTLEDWEVRRCDLRKGDIVKVDLPNMRTKNYVVRGFKDFISTKDIADAAAKDENPLTDVYGAKSVVLEVKRRESLPESTSRETVDVPITNVYLTSTMWPQFKDREYKPAPSLRAGFNIRPQTPSTNFSAPGTPTTTTSRRQLLPTPGTSVQRPLATPCASNTTGLFAGMAFALTWHGDEQEKTQVIRLITNNGGQVLDSGFEVLFKSNGGAKDNRSETPRGKSTPKSTSRKKSLGPTTPSTTMATDESQPLTLTPYASSLSFVALISDRYSRRTKYIQALALYLPCLSHHWLSTSLSRNALAPWSLYLLPAGESVALGGAVRSRVIEPMYEAGSEEGRLTSVLERREKLLDGKSVLLVVKQRSRGTAYEFLTRVMGARRVKGCTGVVEARKALLEGTGAQEEEGQSWDWVYVDGGDVEGAVKVFEGGDTLDAVPSTASRSKKRKRESDAAAADESKGDAGIGVRVVDLGGGRKVKVVGDEFVVQSLILGALLE